MRSSLEHSAWAAIGAISRTSMQPNRIMRASGSAAADAIDGDGHTRRPDANSVPVITDGIDDRFAPVANRYQVSRILRPIRSGTPLRNEFLGRRRRRPLAQAFAHQLQELAGAEGLADGAGGAEGHAHAEIVEAVLGVGEDAA